MALRQVVLVESFTAENASFTLSIFNWIDRGARAINVWRLIRLKHKNNNRIFEEKKSTFLLLNGRYNHA